MNWVIIGSGNALSPVGAKPLPEPILTDRQLDHLEQTSVKFESKYQTFHSWKCIWKCCVQNCGHFVQGRWVKQTVSGRGWEVGIPSVSLLMVGSPSHYDNMLWLCSWPKICSSQWTHLSTGNMIMNITENHFNDHNIRSNFLRKLV